MGDVSLCLGASAAWPVGCGFRVKIYVSLLGFPPGALWGTICLGKYGLLVIGFSHGVLS